MTQKPKDKHPVVLFESAIVGDCPRCREEIVLYEADMPRFPGDKFQCPHCSKMLIAEWVTE